MSISKGHPKACYWMAGELVTVADQRQPHEQQRCAGLRNEEPVTLPLARHWETAEVCSASRGTGPPGGPREQGMTEHVEKLL